MSILDIRDIISEELEYIYENEDKIAALVNPDMRDIDCFNLERITFSSEYILFQFYTSGTALVYNSESKFIVYQDYLNWKKEQS